MKPLTTPSGLGWRWYSFNTVYSLIFTWAADSVREHTAWPASLTVLSNVLKSPAFALEDILGIASANSYKNNSLGNSPAFALEDILGIASANSYKNSSLGNYPIKFSLMWAKNYQMQNISYHKKGTSYKINKPVINCKKLNIKWCKPILLNKMI